MPKSISKTQFESSVKNRLNTILSNRTEGAAGIERATFELLEDIHNSGRATPRILLGSIDAVKVRFPLMANIISLAAFVTKTIERTGAESLPEKLGEYKAKTEQDRRETIEKASAIIRKYNSIFTFSSSSSVKAAIIQAKGAGWKGIMFLTESRPHNEGTILAAQLASKGVDVTLAVDAAMAELIDRSDAVFLGADCVTPTFFVNKVGSRAVVYLARKKRIPAYVIFDKSKIVSNRDYRFRHDENPGTEISKIQNPNLSIVNRYFEKVKSTSGLRYITDNRIIIPGKL